MKNQWSDLKNHLFATLEGLADEDSPMDVDRAKAVTGVAGKLIEMAKVETKVIELTGRQGEGSVLPNPERPALPGSH
ncbi:MAG: hypothetical protein KDI42_11265 [Gammaproteobacteria bacterium]|nr:hypothetical protein [Gammaproteobacteria bacterium]